MVKKRTYTTEQREAQRARVREHYKNNKQYYVDKARARNTLVREELKALIALHTTPCVDCGFDDSRALQFDHVRGEKKFNISDGLKKAVSRDTMKAELDKCEVRCANCHSIVTHERRFNTP